MNISLLCSRNYTGYQLDLEFSIKFYCYVLNVFYGIAPSYLCDLLAPYNPSCYNFRSCSGNLLHVPKSALVTGGDRSFSCVAPRLWNQLPDYIRNLNNLQHFKSALKTHLFELAFFT